MEFLDYLKKMVTEKASDLYLTVGAPPILKIQGQHIPVNDIQFKPGEIKKMAFSFMPEAKQQLFEKTWELNMALPVDDLGRFRINVFMQRDEVAIVIRCIQMTIPAPDEIFIPSILKTEVMKKNGLILFVGATGAGKSTSLASLIQYRSEQATGHILTVEDPIEFLHKHGKSIINQREIGVDTNSYSNALENAMRQTPDVILVGEIRDHKTMEYAMTFAETGHLCLSTLHAHDAIQAIDRVINFFPQDRHNQLLLDLSLNLNAIVSQRLVNTLETKRRIAAFEVLLATPSVADMIKRGEISSLRDIMQKSENLGMQTFDTALFNLYKQGLIDENEALHNANSPNNVHIKINLSKGIKVGNDSFTIKSDNDKGIGRHL